MKKLGKERRTCLGYIVWSPNFESSLSMNIRPPRQEDLKEIRTIYADWYIDELGKPEEDEVFYWTRQVDDSVIHKNNVRYRVADDENEIVGIIGWREDIHPSLTRFAKGKAVELYDLFVRKGHQGRGIGSMLMRHFLDEAKKHYKEIIFVSADRFKGSWQFYDDLGFKHIADLPYKHGKGLHRVYWKNF